MKIQNIFAAPLIIIIILIVIVGGIFFYRNPQSNRISLNMNVIELPLATLGKTYSYPLSASPTIISGRLPRGMHAAHEALPCLPSSGNCDTHSFAIFGTPQDKGRYDFTLQFSDASSTQAYDLVVQ